MKIVVIGGTGLIGSKVVAILTEYGHQTLAASPRLGINTLTGEGLAEALDGASVVVDVSNSPSFEPAAVMDFFRTSTSNLLAAEAAAGVGHHVALSIVGIDRSSTTPTQRQGRGVRPTERPPGYCRSGQAPLRRCHPAAPEHAQRPAPGDRRSKRGVLRLGPERGLVGSAQWGAGWRHPIRRLAQHGRGSVATTRRDPSYLEASRLAIYTLAPQEARACSTAHRPETS